MDVLIAAGCGAFLIFYGVRAIIYKEIVHKDIYGEPHEEKKIKIFGFWVECYSESIYGFWAVVAGVVQTLLGLYFIFIAIAMCFGLTEYYRS